MDKNEIRHRRIRTNGIEMHVAEIGAPKCPLVLLLHGFPELWFSWRHQMVGIAEHGYHVVAPDMRGYGDTESPADSFSYTILHLLGDLIGLLDAFDREKVSFPFHLLSILFVNYLCVWLGVVLWKTGLKEGLLVFGFGWDLGESGFCGGTRLGS